MTELNVWLASKNKCSAAARRDAVCRASSFTPAAAGYELAVRRRAARPEPTDRGGCASGRQLCEVNPCLQTAHCSINILVTRSCGVRAATIDDMTPEIGSSTQIAVYEQLLKNAYIRKL